MCCGQLANVGFMSRRERPGLTGTALFPNPLNFYTTFLTHGCRLSDLILCTNTLLRLQAIVCLRRALELDPYAVDTLPHLATCLCNEQEVVQVCVV